jgi:hypothetical protein
MEKPIKTIYKTKFNEPDVVKAYICCTVDYSYLVHAVNDKSYTLWTGLFDECQVPAELGNSALDLRGHAFNQVEFDKSCPLWGAWI